MKKIYLVFILILSTVGALYPQCSAALRPNGTLFNEFNGSGTPLIKVYWNVVDDGDSPDLQEVQDAINTATSIYNNYGILLVNHCDQNIDIIEDALLTTNQIDGTDRELCNLDQYSKDDGVNIFFMKNDVQFIQGAQGISHIGGGKAVIKINPGENNWRVLVHELGHCFGLFHPFQARSYTSGSEWNCSENDGAGFCAVVLNNGTVGSFLQQRKCDGTSVDRFLEWEKVDGSNASVAGDFVVDTPAEMNIFNGGEGGSTPCNDFLNNCLELDICDNILDDQQRKDQNCQRYQPDWNNYMGYRGDCRDHFTAGQVSRMKGLFNSFLSPIVHKPIFTISQDITIDNPLTASILDIKSDVNVTIQNTEVAIKENGILFIGRGSTLTIDNSTITTCGDIWKGINCNKNAISVEVVNNSIIEKAEIGIKLGSSSFTNAQPINPDQPHPKLYMKNSQVTLCDVGIQFGYGKTESQIIGGSSINKCDIGIKYSNHSGLEIENSYLGNCKEAIYSLDGHFTLLDDVEFWGGNYFPMEVGISAEGTLPLAAGLDIGSDNSITKFFFITGAGIIANGLEHPTGANITNCGFAFSTGGDAAAYFAGANDFDFVNNSVFNIDRGAISFATGDNPNNVNCNEFQDIEIASNVSMFANTSTNFLENHYKGNQNINFALSTSIIPTQGTAENPARNCFSDPNNADHILNASFLNLGIGTFLYNYFDDSAESDPCQIPNNPQNFTTQSYDNQGPGHCGGNIGIFNLISPGGPGSNIGIDPQHDDPDLVCLPCVDDEIDDWINDVVNSGGDDPRTTIDESDPIPDPTLPANEAILNQWINYAIYVALETNNYTYGEQVLIPLVTWEWQIRLYGFYVLQGNLVRAEQVLNLLSEDNDNQIQFKEVQRVNLKRIKQLPISQTEIDDIYEIAIGTEPALGYARSLYRALTGIRLPLLYPEFIGKNGPRSSKKDEFTNSIYPNPTSGELHIAWGIDMQEITILDITGKVMKIEKAYGKSANIDMTFLNKGIYIVQIQDDSNTMTANKIIKI